VLFRAGDLIVVDGKLFAAVFSVRFIAPTSRLHAVKAALSSVSQALIAFPERHRGLSIMSTMFIVPPSERDYSLATHERGQDGY
jgi:hypothetical protein